MTNLEELLARRSPDLAASPPDVDPLRDADALLETQLLDARVGASTSTVGLLFELRTALHFVGNNTALLVGRGVRDFSWSAESRLTPRTAWNVVGSMPRQTGDAFSLELSFIPSARLLLTCETVEFYAGEVVGLAVNPPDYVEDDEAVIRANLPDWKSDLAPKGGTFLGKHSAGAL